MRKDENIAATSYTMYYISYYSIIIHSNLVKQWGHQLQLDDHIIA